MRRQQLLRGITDGTLDVIRLSESDRSMMESMDKRLDSYCLLMVYTPDMRQNKDAHAKSKQKTSCCPPCL